MHTPAPARTARPAPLLRSVLVLAMVLGLLAPASAAGAACDVTPEEGFRLLFDGTEESLQAWTQAGPGGFDIVDCTLESVGGMGLLWYSAEEFCGYTFRADWKIAKTFDNSGIFVGFPDAGDDPWVAVNAGYEIQIDQFGRMDGAPEHYTGAIYDIQGPNRDTRLDPRGWLDWNTYEITVQDPTITVELNGVVVNEFTSTDPARDLSSGHVGLQNHGDIDTTYFRNIQVKELTPCPVEDGEAAPDLQS
jgi:cytochrome c